MSKKHIPSTVAAGLMALGVAQGAQAFVPGVYFTEFLTDTSSSNYFIEITNLTGASIDLSGWGYDNNAARLPSNNLRLLFPESLAPLGQGESLFITSACDNTLDCQEDSEGGTDFGEPKFTTIWGLDPDTKVLSTKLVSAYQPSQGGDDLRLYNASGVQVDKLVYTTSLVREDQSAHIKDTSLLNGGTQSTSNWALSSVGDAYGSYEATGVHVLLAPYEVGNPNPLVTAVPVPEPETYALMLAGLGLVGLAVRRGKRAKMIHA